MCSYDSIVTHYFENHNWNLLYFDTVKQEYQKRKAKIDIDTLVDIKAYEPRKIKKSDPQLPLFS